jgi:hypothetical protein
VTTCPKCHYTWDKNAKTRPCVECGVTQIPAGSGYKRCSNCRKGQACKICGKVYKEGGASWCCRDKKRGLAPEKKVALATAAGQARARSDIKSKRSRILNEE